MLTEDQQHELIIRGAPPLKKVASVTNLESPLFCNLLYDILILGVLGSGPITGASVLVTYPDGATRRGFLTDSHGNAVITLEGTGSYIVLVTPPDHIHCSITLILNVLGTSFVIVTLPNQLANPPTGASFQIVKPGVILGSLHSNCFQGNSSFSWFNGFDIRGYPSGLGNLGATQPIQGTSTMGTFGAGDRANASISSAGNMSGGVSNTGVST